MEGLEKERLDEGPHEKKMVSVMIPLPILWKGVKAVFGLFKTNKEKK